MGCEFTLTKLTLRENGEFFQLWYGLPLTTFHRIHMLHIWLSWTTNSNKWGWGIASYFFSDYFIHKVLSFTKYNRRGKSQILILLFKYGKGHSVFYHSPLTDHLMKIERNCVYIWNLWFISNKTSQERDLVPSNLYTPW